MPPCSTTLQSLDALLEAWEPLDVDTLLLDADPATRQELKRAHELRHIVEKVSVEQLRKHHLMELVKEHRAGCTEYLYTLIRVHAGYELGYHEILSDLHREPQLYDSTKIRAHWQEWWGRNGKKKAFAVLDWRTESNNLCAALNAHTDDLALAARSVSHPNTLVRQALARREDINKDLQSELADDAAAIVRFELARNPNSAPEVLGQLANDLNSIVRRWVAHHPRTPSEVLVHLAVDPIEAVREFLMRRSACR